ncbi:MAG: hypothetical protein LUF89_04195 [Ruminococcus sp.]|nr:hypothetical protein [Ruminococcus sp.]
MLRAGNFKLASYVIGVVLLVLLAVGMIVCERFFCRFFCPMGAVFSLLPILPLFSIRRKKADCAKNCTACQKICPANLDLPESGDWGREGECFQCQKCIQICPKKNARGFSWKLRGNEIWLTLLRAVILAAVLILACV